MDAAKSMGEAVGTVASIGRSGLEVRLNKGITLNNGDGFSFVGKDGKVEGFRGDVCTGGSIRCKAPASLFVGAVLFRNINAAFEKEIERKTCQREIRCSVRLVFSGTYGQWSLKADAVSEDGRKAFISIEAGDQKADNQERMTAVLYSQIGKSAGHYRFSLDSIDSPEGLPFMSASTLNSVRRSLAEELDAMPCMSKPLLNRILLADPQARFTSEEATYRQNVSNALAESVYIASGVRSIAKAYELEHSEGAELMRTKYCIRYELGMCPVHQGAKKGNSLFLMNNGRRLALHFDCPNCEMVVKEG